MKRPATDEEIREHERKEMAQMLLKEMGNVKRVLQPGLWYAATLLDPSLTEH